MARGLLVSFAGYPVMANSLFPDNGLASLAGTLQAAGHEAKVLDLNTVSMVRRLVRPEISRALADLSSPLGTDSDAASAQALFAINDELEADLCRVTDELVEEISVEVSRQGSDFVGFKLWSGDGFVASVKIAERLRQRFGRLKLYGGGPAVFYSGETIFAHTTVFDALVVGEGELVISDLAAHAQGRASLAEIPNLLVHADGAVRHTETRYIEDLGSFAFPAYDAETYPSLANDEQIKYFVVDETRGCPMRCAFCIHPSASGDGWRPKTPERVLAEIETLIDLHNTCCFRLGGSYTPPEFYSSFAELLMGSGRKILFNAFAHPEGLPPQPAEVLAAAGCRGLFFGIESFDPVDQQRLHKKLNNRRVTGVIGNCIEAGIVPTLSMIVPVPGQTREAQRANRDLLIELCAGAPAIAMVIFPGLLPYTQWWQRREDFGFRLEVEAHEYQRLLATYKIRHIIPPSFWEPLPYTLDGEDFKTFAAVCGRFQRDLAAAGVIVNAPDDLAVMADLTGEPLTDLRDRHREIFFTLDAEAIATFVAHINRAAAST